MKKQDYILAGLILIISLALNLYISSYANKNDMSGNYVVVYVDGDPVGYEVTLGTVPDASGNTHYEYIYKA